MNSEIRFLEQRSDCSREAAKDCSPRRKPWELCVGDILAPEGRKKTSHS